MQALESGISIDQAARRVWDCVVIGAGPAGALAAHELARRGFGVLLADEAEFPRRKVCGCCLNGRTLHILRATGLGAIPMAGGAVPLLRFQLAAGGRQVTLSLPAGAALSRERLDAALVLAAIEKGAAFLPQTRAVFDGRADDTARVLLRGGSATAVAAARLVLAAAGLGGRWAGKGSLLAAIPDAIGPMGMGAVLQTRPRVYAR